LPYEPRGNDVNYVFLICSERCGSNLISAMMGAHSMVMSPPPYHFGRDVILNLHLRESSSTGWWIVRDQLVNQVNKLASEAEGAELSDWIDTHPQATAAELARRVYSGIEPKHGATTVFVKENNLHKLLFFILVSFPEAKFVFQVRDPRDYLASAQARRRAWSGNKFGSTRQALQVWRDDQLGGLALLGVLGRERVFFQRYEDLVSRPREVLEPLCEFIGLNFERGIIDFHESEQAVRRAESSSARANVGKPLMAGNFGKYRENLSRGTIRTVETWLGDLMDRFGYARDYPPCEPRGLRVFGPQFSEPFERLLNGETESFYTTGQKRFLRQLRGISAPVTPAYDVPRGEPRPR
jgi:hypothetical protein